ncbi:hypothetical protein BCR33DRAFT_483872 [Rhizoclosmatium globosum]|uniref:Dynamin N-terminal domain-containing protein n=1 Tax=Rhizoclosmatium globosum TaxID=329046 RepID=A0A1Y2BMW7_9FUNG|nr:hypothetical protein BCR33DRAFT_483872 [Rhizoclosmatium globosum]|eukprot:ORY36106.1 hypothetical protein BCR33DRAFT_483872 [Rhizoclosmatium globosum]
MNLQEVKNAIACLKALEAATEFDSRIDDALKVLATADVGGTNHEIVVAVAGLINSGKSTIINALLATGLCPMGDEPETGVALTIRALIREQANMDLYSNNTDSSFSLVGSGNAEKLRAHLKTINTSVRKVPLETSTKASTHSVNGNFQFLRNLSTSSSSKVSLLDLPGTNEAGALHIQALGKDHIALADVLLVVTDATQMETDAEYRFWQRLASSNIQARIIVFVNKVDTLDDSDDGESVTTRLVSLVKRYTNDAISLEPSQVFAGNASQSLVAKSVLLRRESIAKVPCDNLEWLPKLCKNSLNVSITGWSSIHDLESKLMKALGGTSCENILTHNKWADFEDGISNAVAVANQSREERCLHRIQSVCASMLNVCDSITAILKEKLVSAQAELNTHIALEKKLEEQVRVCINNWVDTEQARLFDAIQTPLSNLYPKLVEATNKISRFVEATDLATIEKVIKTLAKETKLYSDAISKGIEHIGVNIAESRTRLESRLLQDCCEQSSIEILPSAARSDTIKLLLSLTKSLSSRIVDLSKSELDGFLKTSLRFSSGPSKTYSEYLQYGDTSTVISVGIPGSVSEGGCWKLGHNTRLQFFIKLPSNAVGLPCMLNLKHLTSDAGRSSRAEVTVKYNGRNIRSRYDPFQFHSPNGGRVGFHSYAEDSWFVDGSFNNSNCACVEIFYVSGTSKYWLQQIGISCELPGNQIKQVDVGRICWTKFCLCLAICGVYQKKLEFCLRFCMVLQFTRISLMSINRLSNRLLH